MSNKIDGTINRLSYATKKTLYEAFNAGWKAHRELAKIPDFVDTPSAGNGVFGAYSPDLIETLKANLAAGQNETN